MDAIHYHVRSEGQIVKKAVYIAIGVNLDGRKDVLGMWVGENESAKYWATPYIICCLFCLRSRLIPSETYRCNNDSQDGM